MSRHYSDPKRAGETWALPNVEVFEVTAQEFWSAFVADDSTWLAQTMSEAIDVGFDAVEAARDLAGWYYWYCFPGCLPDSEPCGPYASETDAVEAAQEE